MATPEWATGSRASRFGKFKRVFNVSTTKGKLAVFLLSFALIGGGYMAYQSFAATSPRPSMEKIEVLSSDTLPQINDKLVKALKSYESSSQADKPQQLDQLKQLALGRMNKMMSAMESGDKPQPLDQPKPLALSSMNSTVSAVERGDKSVESNFLPEQVLQRFPGDIQDMLEKKVDLDGTMAVIAVTGIKKEDKRIDSYLTVKSDEGDKTHKVHFGNRIDRKITSGSKVKIKGIGLADKVYISSDSGGSVQTTSTPLAPAVVDTKSLLVIMVNFTNDTSQPFTKADVHNSVFVNPDSTNALIKEGSFNKTSLTGAVTNWLTINSTSTDCAWPAPGTWANLADQAAISAGHNVSSYNHVMYMFPPTSSCTHGGLGEVAAKRTWIFGPTYHMIKTHELGHNFGAWHSGYLDCRGSQTAQDVLSSCDFIEYGEADAQMGSGAWRNFQFNALNRRLFNWIPTTQLMDVTSNGTYTVASDYSTDTTLPKILQIAKPDSGDNYNIAFKQAVGFNALLSPGSTKGVSVYIKPTWRLGTPHGSDTALLAMQTGMGSTNASLGNGGVFYDVGNGITVTQLSRTTNTATVSVRFGAIVCVKANPTISVSPISQIGSPGSTLNYTATVTNRNSGPCSPSTYNITGVVPAGFTSSGSSVTLSSGASVIVSIPVTSQSSQAVGSYIITITATATDSADSALRASVNATNVVYTPRVDTIPPKVSITFPTSGKRLSTVSGNFTISAKATDNIAVAIVEFYINGKWIGNDTSSPYSYRWDTSKLTAGSYTIRAEAWDTSGNKSSHAVKVNVTK